MAIPQEVYSNVYYGDGNQVGAKMVDGDKSYFPSKADMAWELGSNQGPQCWCGNKQASGYVHQKVWHPHSCGSEECEELDSQYQSLPDGEEWKWETVFGQPCQSS